MNKWNISRRIFAGLLSALIFVSALPVTPATAEDQNFGTTADGGYTDGSPLFSSLLTDEDTTPTTSESEDTTPTTLASEDTTPTTSAPEDTTPTTSVPEDTAPTTSVPEDTTPTASTPADTTPTTSAPADTTPTTPTPTETTPAATTPEETKPDVVPQPTKDNTVVTAAMEPIVSAVIYTNREYTVQDVDLSATKTLSGWDEDTNRYLKVSLNNLDPDANYQIVVYTDPAIYATNLDFTNQNWDENQQTTKHTKIAVNKGGSYTPNANSGTTTYTVRAGTNGLDLNLELNYDWVFWDRSADAALGYYAAYQGDTSKPLISVELQKVTGTDTAETVSTLSLDSATAGKIKNTVFTSQSQTILTNEGAPATTINAEQRVRFRLASFYNFLCKDVTFKITLPHLEYNGTMYSMELDTGHSFPVTGGGSANYTLTQETTPEGVNTATFHFTDYYTTSNFRHIYFKLPSDEEAIKTLEQAASTHEFTDGVIEIYRGEELVKTLSGCEIQMVRSGINIIEFENATTASRRNKASLANLGKIQYLDLFAAYNSGTIDSGAATVHAVFDSNNKKTIGVTAMCLMAPKGTTVTAKYTMIDSEGNVHECPAPVTLKNTSTDTKGDKYGVLFTRADLPAPFNTYYFKTITYVTNFPANLHLFDSDGLQRPNSGGTVWGEVLVDTVPTSANRSKNTFSIYDGDFLNADFDSSKLLVTASRPVAIQGNAITQQIASYGIYTPRVSLPGGSKKKTVEIKPGEAAIITAQVQVTNYPYTTKSSIDNLRVALRLPIGATINQADLSITLGNGTEVDVTKISYTPVTVGDSIENLWVMELDPSVEIGYYNEYLEPLPNGAVLNLKIPVQTELTTLAGRIKVDDVLFVASVGHGQGVTSGNLKNYRVPDTYGLLGPCDGLAATYKYVGACRKDKPENIYINIGAPNAELDITDSLVGSETGKMLSMKKYDETIQYKLDVNCNISGTVSGFYYYIPVPKANCEDKLDFVDETSELSLKLTGPAQITFSDENVPLKVMYTTDTNLTYESAASANWLEADQITGDGWADVTLMKVAPVDATSSMKNGTSVHVLASFGFDGDEQTYARSAGGKVQWKSKGFYNYNLGVGAIQGNYPTKGVSLNLSYTAPVQKLTLTAAKDRKPSTEGAQIAVLDLNDLINGNFVNTPTFAIKNIETVGNLTLVASGTDFAAMTSADSNTKFAVTAKLNEGTAEDLLTGSTVEKLNVPKDGTAKFSFEIFNGNVITENAQTKTVTLELVGSNSATIPVEITILRELAAAEPENPGILGGKQYALFDDITDSISVRKNSAFTAQFVAKLVPQNYLCPILTVSGNPTGPLIMIDWTVPDSPKYYRASIPAGGSLPLTSFVRIDGAGGYVYPTGDTQISQSLLFIFDEAGASDGSVTLTQADKTGKTFTQTLFFDVSDNRGFSVGGGGTTVPGAPVTVSYFTDTDGPTDANDSFYQNRELALIVTGTDLPVDLHLIADGTRYYRNPYGEFIIPLNDIQTAGAGSIAITPVTSAKDPACTLTAELWAGATDAGERPHMGQLVADGVTITVTGTGDGPALKVLSMSNRMIKLSELSKPVTVEVEKANFTSDTSVVMTVQVKEGNGYANLAAVLDRQTGLDDDNGTDRMTLRFNIGTALGTYRLLFTVKNGTETMEIPYNFLVIED